MSGGNGLGGELRFSIEDLLYYAPRFVGVGETLAAAASAAQKRLEGLGPFWGGSSPDRAFADSYPPSEYALLITVKQVAVALQGIGGGIEVMARNYQITEADIEHDMQRINSAIGDESTLLSHTGGLPPPPDLTRPLPPQAPPTPTPTPQQSPTPPGSRAPSPPPVPPGVLPGPEIHTTPSPAPGESPDPNAWRKRDATTWWGPWPSGNPDLMDEAAAAWKVLASALDTAWSDTQRYTAYVLSDNQGPAADAFDKTVQELIDRDKGMLTHALQACEQLQMACATQAQAIRDLKHAVEALLIELFVTFIITQGIALLTFETTQAASEALAAGLIGRIVETIADFIRLVIKLSTTMREAIAKVIAKGIVGGRIGLLTAGATVPVNNWISGKFGQEQAKGTEQMKQILESGALAVFGGSFAASAGEPSTALRNLGEQGGPASAALTTLSRQLKSGSITVTAANGALQQLMQNGKIDQVKYVAAVTGARFQTAVKPHTGEHAR
jgi:uncharacterized protein YukE